MKIWLVLLAGLLSTISVSAKTVSASSDNATLSFAGEHAGMKFAGVFNQWESTLILPPSDNPKIEAVFEVGSAETGDSTYDETLPESDWFDAEQFPQATFTATEITQESGGFRVTGELSLKGKSNAVSFVLAEEGQTLNAQFRIDRLAYGIGVESDPDAEWVSQFIQMSLSIPL